MDRVGWFMYDNEEVSALQREHRARPGNLDVAHAAADKAAALIGRRLPDQPNITGMVVHYALGVLPGAVYAVFFASVSQQYGPAAEQPTVWRCSPSRTKRPRPCSVSPQGRPGIHGRPTHAAPSLTWS